VTSRKAGIRPLYGRRRLHRRQSPRGNPCKLPSRRRSAWVR
jgi:hypothetical protein